MTRRKLSICEMTYDMETPFQERVDETARHGIEAMSLVSRTFREQDARHVRRILSDAGVKVAGYNAIGRFTEPGRFDANIESSKKAIENAAEVGAEFAVMLTGPLAGMTWDEASDRFLEGVHAIVPFARERNMPLALEPMHPLLASTAFVHSLGDALDIAARVEGLGIQFDTWHLWWDRRLLADIPTAARVVRNVHMSDFARPVAGDGGGQRLPLGEGMIPLERILHALDRAGFDEYYELEVIGEFTAERRKTLVADCIRAFDSIWA